MKYISVLDNKIFSSGDVPVFKVDDRLVQNIEVEDDIAENWFLYDIVDGKPVYSEQKAIAIKQDNVREVRNQYLVEYVDPQQLYLRWVNLDAEEQKNITDYRTYLLDYTTKPEWYEKNPLTLDEWKHQQSINMM